MNSLDIDGTVYIDLLARLTAGGVANVYRLGALRTGTATGVGIGIDLADSLPGGQGPTGFREARVAVDVSTEMHDDATGATLLALVATVRTALQIDDLVTVLNGLSSYATYYGWTLGDESRYSEARQHHWLGSFSIWLRPGNATTTSTTTSSTSTTTSTTTGV